MLLVDATGLLADWPAILSTLSGIPAGERALMITGRVNPFSGFAPEEDGRVVEELDAGVLKFFVRPGMKTGDSAAVYVHEAEHVQQIRDLVRTRWRSFPAPAITANERVLDEVDAWEQAVEFIESRYQGNALDVIQNAPRNFARWRTWKREGSIALMVDVMQQYSGRYTDIERPCKIVTPLVVRGASN